MIITTIIVNTNIFTTENNKNLSLPEFDPTLNYSELHYLIDIYMV